MIVDISRVESEDKCKLIIKTEFYTKILVLTKNDAKLYTQGYVGDKNVKN